VIETGHSLGGQEADFVEVNAVKDKVPYSFEAVTFNAPGLGDDVPISAGFSYDALNISAFYDLVHTGGSMFNNGYAGTSVTIDAGQSLVPAASAYLLGYVALNPLMAIAGFGTFLYQGFGANHSMGTMRSYLDAYPALGNINLQTYQPNQISQGMVDAMGRMTSAQWASMSSDQRVTYLQGALSSGDPTSSSSSAQAPVINETFIPTADSSGNIVLTGSDGDVFTLSTSDTTLTLTDQAGNQEVETFNGTSGGQETWTGAAGARSTGTMTYAADGSSNGKLTFANGSYATSQDDGAGDLLIEYYDAAGQLVHESWQYNDGSSGSAGQFNDGKDVYASGPGATMVAVQTLINADGSYVTETVDANDVKVTTTYSKTGAVISTTTAAQGGLGNDVDPTRVETVAGITSTYDAVTNALTRQTFTATDTEAGTWVKGELDIARSGDQSGTVQRSDGTSQSFTLYGNPSIVFGQVALSADVDNPTHTLKLSDLASTGSDATVNDFDASGNLIKSQWKLADGANGTESFTGGTGTGTIHHADGSTSAVTVTGDGGIRIDNQDSSGQVASSDWWKADGTHGINLYAAGQLVDVYTYQVNGQVVLSNADGSVTQTLNAGAVISPDDTFFDKQVNADGSAAVDYTDGNGDTLSFEYSAGGALTGTDQFSISRDPMAGGFGSTLPDGTQVSSPYNGLSAILTEADGAVVTEYVNPAGRVVADDWVKADGSHGTQVFYTDGSSAGTTDQADGTMYQYSKDADGSLETAYYDASGNETAYAWTDADGSHGSETYAADGSVLGADYAIDGSHDTYADDGQGNVAYTDYAADGTETGYQYQNADGSYGESEFDPDGSAVSTQVAADGSYLVVSVDAANDNDTKHYSASGTLVGDGWTRTDGTHGSIAYRADGSTEAVSFAADGSSTDTTTKGDGSSTTYAFDAAGTLAGDAWTDAQGDSGTDAFAAGGAMSGHRANADGTSSSYATDASGVTTTKHYDAGGRLVDTVVDNADGSTTTNIDDGAGNASTTVRDAQGNLVSDSWTKSDGTHGTDTVSGATKLSVTYRADGSHVSQATDALGTLTVDSYDAGGRLLESAWSRVNGSHGDTLYAADGSSTATSTSPDGSYELQAVDAAGNSDARYYSPSGVLQREVQTDASGASTQHQYVAGDANADFLKDGIVAKMRYADDAGHPYSTSTQWWDSTPRYGLGDFVVSAADGTALQKFTLDFDQSYEMYGGPANVVDEMAETTYGQGGDSVARTVEKRLAYQPMYSQALGDAFDSQWDPWNGFFGYYRGDGDLVSSSGGGGSTTVTTTEQTPHPNPTLRIDALVALGGGRVELQLDGEAFIYDAGLGAVRDLGALGDPDSGAPYVIVSGIDGAVTYAQTTVISAHTRSHDVDAYDDGTTVTSDFADGFLQAAQLSNADGSRFDYEAHFVNQWGNGSATVSGRTSTGFSVQASGDVYYGYPRVFDLVLRNPDGSVAESNHVTGGGSGYDDWAKDQFGNVFAADITNAASGTGTTDDTDALGDTIHAVYGNTGGYLKSATVDESWIESDGTTVTLNFDSNTAASTATMKYADGNSTVLTSTRDGSYLGRNFDSTGFEVGDEWANAADGSHGSDTMAFDGSSTQRWIGADGTTVTQAHDAATGEETGTTHHADGSVDAWDTVPLADGASESRTSNTAIDGVTTAYDTVTQADGSFSQAWTSTDGTSGTNLLDAASGQDGGSLAGADGSVTSWTHTPLAGGGVETDAHYAYADGSWVTVDAMQAADGAAWQHWTKSDGSKGANFYGAAGSGGDTFAWGRGDGASTMQVPDDADVLAIGTAGAGVADDQLWFRQDGNDLDISILGGDDWIDVQGWYSGGGQLGAITLADGRTLNGGDVQKLVEAMASFAVPDASQTTYTPAQAAALAPVLAANWHH
jgi:hypothetical protein